MKPQRRFFFLFLTACLFLMALGPAWATSPDRGVTVTLKQSERPGAPDAGEVRLYSASYALVIGIDDYANGWPRLSNAVKDAELVAEALKEQGFTVTLKKNLGSRDLQQALEEFFVYKGQDPDARLFVWFAGHGHTLDGEGFLVPADAPLPSQKALFRLKALSLRRFGELVRLADSKHALAVFDSCFSGTVFATSRSAPPPAITRDTTLPVREYVSSGDADQEVSDDGSFRNLFIRALKGEDRADSNADGYLTGTELGLYLTDRMSNLSNNRQTPRYGKLRDLKWDRGDFVFLLAGSGVAEEAPVAESTGEAQLTVTANVDGARVLLDNEAIGTAPLRDRAVPPGSHGLTVEKDGYDSFRTRLNLDPGRRVSLEARLSPLAPAKARLFVNTTPPDARVRIVGAGAAYSPGVELECGRYQVEVSAAGFDTDTQWVALSPGEDKYLAVTLAKARKTGHSAKDFTNSLGMQFVSIAPGSFVMGESSDRGRNRNLNEEPHQVTLTKGFLMQDTEVTAGQWREFARAKGYRTKAEKEGSAHVWTGWNWSPSDGIRWDSPGFAQDDSHPVTCVSWEDAKAFAKWLSRKEGRTYRLPTEAEWEYACRAGTKSEYFFGDDKSSLNDYAWDMFNADNRTHPVATKKPNAWGLYDMHGNVWEWCGDWYKGDLSGSAKNPTGPASGSGRVTRGGSWNSGYESCRSAFRDKLPPDMRMTQLGFRLVLEK